MEEIRNRAMTWVYVIVNFDTKEIFTVLSRKFLDEFAKNLRGDYYFDCIGAFNYEGIFMDF